jgi:hypothetical protein
MGGLPCAKQVIDNGNALHQKLQCMNASILLAAPRGVEPTYAEVEEFRKKADELAIIAAVIEKRVRSEAEI